jgi:hypothetical protein
MRGQSSSTAKDRERLSALLERHGGIVGRVELAKQWGVSRQRVAQLLIVPDFPEPIATANGGPVWLADECDAWKAARPGPGRPAA